MKVEISSKLCGILGLIGLMGCAGSPLRPVKVETDADKYVLAELNKVGVVFSQLQNPSIDGITSSLRHPTTVTNAQDIVRLDNRTLFPRAERVFEEHLADFPEDLENLTWQVQLYLSWLESLAVCAKLQETMLESMSVAESKNRAAVEKGELMGDDINAAHIFTTEFLKITRSARRSIHQARMVAANLITKIGNLVPIIITRNPESYRGYRLDADFLRLTGRMDEDYDEALVQVENFNPNSNSLRFLKASKASFHGDHEEAIRLLDDALDKDPAFLKARLYKAISLSRMSQPQAALRIITDVLGENPGHPSALAYRWLISSTL